MQNALITNIVFPFRPVSAASNKYYCHDAKRDPRVESLQRNTRLEPVSSGKLITHDGTPTPLSRGAGPVSFMPSQQDDAVAAIHVVGGVRLLHSVRGICIHRDPEEAFLVLLERLGA